MSPNLQPSPDNASAFPLDVAAIGKVVRDELDRQNKYLEFAQGQIEKDRSFYKHLYAFAGAFLAFMVTVAGIFSYTSVTQMRTDMKASVDAELVALRAQAGATSSEAQATVKGELANVRTEVQKRIDTEFRSENIASLVANAARERTEKELSGIIRSETAVQVAKGIRDQGPVITKAVQDQTKEAVRALEPTIKATVDTAVKALEPTIRTSVDKATADQVKASVIPIQAQLANYADVIRRGNLATLARSDDRAAFDYLIQVALGAKPESANPDLRKLADSTAGAIISDAESGLSFGRSFKEKQSPDAMKKFMVSSDFRERAAALDSYPQDDNSILPILIQIITSDSNISVVHKAVIRFNGLTKQSFEFWKTNDILEWWGKNRASFQ
jgi:hypothetical protein